MKVEVFDDPEAAGRAAAEAVAASAREAVASRGRFTVAFSGGSSPFPMLSALVD